MQRQMDEERKSSVIGKNQARKRMRCTISAVAARLVNLNWGGVIREAFVTRP
jgi:hypothetical protein